MCGAEGLLDEPGGFREIELEEGEGILLALPEVDLRKDW